MATKADNDFQRVRSFVIEYFARSDIQYRSGRSLCKAINISYCQSLPGIDLLILMPNPHFDPTRLLL